MSLGRFLFARVSSTYRRSPPDRTYVATRQVRPYRFEGNRMTFSDIVGDESDSRVLENCVGEDQYVTVAKQSESVWNQGRIMNDPTKESARINIFKTFTLKWWQTGLFKWGMLAFGNCNWNLLARFVWRLSSYSHKHGHGHFGVCHICVVEAINTLPAGPTFSRSPGFLG